MNLAVTALVLALMVCAPLEAQTPRIALVPVLSGLAQPVFLTTARDGTNRWFIIEQIGRIRMLEPQVTGSTLFLDITSRVQFSPDSEQGLLGLTFHSQFASNGRYYVNYTSRPVGSTVVAEYRDGVEQRVLFTVPQPYANHNGGMIEFGPDGYLYVGMGDGGSANDPGNRAQNPNDRLGKMLRIHVDIPGSQPEIFASGLRNPWRFSFDRQTGELYAGDVGQNAREEIDIITEGGNYGWRVWEGTLCTTNDPGRCLEPSFIPPITEYANGPGGRCSVTGGYVYRGLQQSLPYGAYVFGDFCTGEIFMFKDGVQTVLLDTTAAISSFGEDESGEIYVVDHNGSIFHIVNPDPVIQGQRTFAIDGSSAFGVSTAGFATSLTVGYGRIQADSGQPVPPGLAIFGFRLRGVLVSEASVPASRAVAGGRVFAEIAPNVNTGIALANPNEEAATVSFFFTDRNGSDFGGGTVVIPPKRQIASFLNEPPFNGGNAISGTFSFESTVPIAALALRGFTNERGDFLITTLPVAETGAAPSGSLTVAHFASGGGWTTELLLVNPSNAPINGTAQFVSPSGQVIQTTPYSIAPRSSERISFTGAGAAIQTGSVRLSSDVSAVSVFAFRTSGVTVSQAGVPTQSSGVAFRTYIESGPGIRSGIAIANPSGSAVDVTLEASGLSATISLPANGQTAMFINEIPALAQLPASFQGVLRITSTAPVVVNGLRGRINERGEFLITATTPVDEGAQPGGSELFFPHFAEGAGYSMQFIVFGRGAAGTMYFFDQGGNPAPLVFR